LHVLRCVFGAARILFETFLCTLYFSASLYSDLQCTVLAACVSLEGDNCPSKKGHAMQMLCQACCVLSMNPTPTQSRPERSGIGQSSTHDSRASASPFSRYMGMRHVATSPHLFLLCYLPFPICSHSAFSPELAPAC
jgi:hypothetical protein